jgi:hypothetical protein
VTEYRGIALEFTPSFSGYGVSGRLKGQDEVLIAMESRILSWQEEGDIWLANVKDTLVKQGMHDDMAEELQAFLVLAALLVLDASRHG